MKRLTHVSILLAALMLCSCTDWLDVKRKTEISKEDLFDSTEGFCDALTSAYLRLKGDWLYSGEMTFGTIERLAQHWEVSDEAWKKYDYENSLLSSPLGYIFEEYYKVILDVNGVIDMTVEKRHVLTDEWYGLIRGEALAIRAFCHLELLRMWGPAPGRESDSPILPYVKTVDIGFNEHHTYGQYTAMIEADLIEAEGLLRNWDPVLNFSIETLANPGSTTEEFDPESDFWTSRQVRVNYYAVAAILARFYLWTKDSDEAHRYAKIVIDAANSDGTAKFTLANERSLNGEDYSFSTEHIFAIKNSQLYLINQRNFGDETPLYYVNREAIEKRMYGDGEPDIRLSLWKTPTSLPKYLKTDRFRQTETVMPLQIPVIRLAEMYLIAIETAPVGEANRLYAEFSAARNIQNPTLVTDPSQIKGLMIKEYNKEFYGEGQMFFTYKRFFHREITDATVYGSDEVYTIPLPDSEAKYTK